MGVSSALPRVILSRAALRQNIATFLRPGDIIDLRHDALGHGSAEVAALVVEAGAGAVLVDDVAALEGVAVEARLDGDADVDPHALFGIPSASGLRGEPVMQLQGRVLSTKPLHAGEAVSYGYTHRAARDTRVALVTGGYAQGILRALGNHVRVQIGDILHPIVGRIAMDVCVVDLEGDDVPADAPVTYFGAGKVRDGLGEWASVAGLTSLEIATVIGRHVPREWNA